MSPRKKQKKPLVEESSSDDDCVENPQSKPEDSWLKNSPSRPNYFDTLTDSDDEDVGVQNLNNVEDNSNIVALPTSSHSNLLQFLHKQNAQVQKEIIEGKFIMEIQNFMGLST